MANDYIRSLFTSSEVLWRKGFVNTIDSSFNRFLDLIEEGDNEYLMTSQNGVTPEGELVLEEREDFIHKF
ncbi:MAG: hypothetical protein SCALA702_23650 [Melioribacteraceae bacterium]|nr:MAG: hypothetical protein SCALA702_23650 [Melioribacteraceae bacterium]